jgi:aminodeoxyfutalosine synthase
MCDMTTTTSIEPLLERLLAGETLTTPEQAALFDSRELLSLGMAADEIRRRRHGAQVTFVRVVDVALENAAAGRAAWEGSPGEIRITGTPGDFGQALAAVSAVVAAAGAVPVTAFSLGDIEAASGDASTAAAWLTALKRAGLCAVAEAPVDTLRSPDALIGAAAAAGLPIARMTVDRAAESGRPALLARAASLVQAYPAIDVFAPLPRKTGGLAPSTGYDDVHLVALARLLVPVQHIQVDWQRYGPKLAQVALTFGADDVDGVSARDEVAEGRRRSPLEEIRRNILAASGEPTERRALFAWRG